MTATAPATPAAQSTPDTGALITETNATLIVWIPPEITRTEAGANSLADQILAFDMNRPNIAVRLEQKPVRGQGGILSYLRAGRNIAPAILPHLIALPADQLATAAAEGLIFPLDGLIEPALLDDLYLATLALVQIDNETLGYPFMVTNLSHLAYNMSVITNTLPTTWSQFILEPNNSLAFPAAGRDGAILALQFYLAAGGDLTNEAGQPSLQLEPLITALTQLSSARDNGLVAQQSNNIATLQEAWQAWQTGAATLVQTTADQFLAARSPELQPGFGTIPGLEVPLVPLIDGWAWAISTADQAQHILAIELLVTLASSPNMGDWSLQNQSLPARRTAFTLWPADDVYIRFVRQEMERAQPNPVSTGSTIMNALSDAVFDVISLNKSPQIAAEEVLAAIQP